MKRKKHRKTIRNLFLPGWLKLRINNDGMNQANYMINSAEEVNADSVSLRLGLKHRPWDVILTVKRRHR